MKLNALAWLIPLLVVACDEPPPPPPLPTATMSSATPTTSASQVAPPAKRQGMDVKKKLRAELCYYAGFGARYSLGEYDESLGGAEPSKTKVPSFGDFGQQGKRGRLPYDSRLRACSAAQRLARGKWPALDEALKGFATQATSAARVLSHASGYYARKEYEADDMVAGKETHRQIQDSLGSFSQQHDVFGAAFLAWLDAIDPSVDEEGRNEVGKRSLGIVVLARKVTTMLLSAQRDAEAEKAALAELEEGISKLASSPKLAVLSRQATAMVETAKATPAGKLDDKQRYEIASRFAMVLESDNRVVEQSLRGGRQAPRH